MKEPLVDILLATYQGENYIQEQIDSIFSQTFSDFHLWIRDDGSTDETLPFLIQLTQRYPKKVTLLPTDGNVGIVSNFSKLLEASRAPYVCFADQDDKWLPNKIEWTLACMRKLEKENEPSTPLLVHTDLTVVGKDLSLIHPSFWGYTCLNPHYTQLNRLLPQNCLTGCTMMFNRPLVNLASPIPLETPMHDWWMALVAACFGKIGVVTEPTLYYRQHGCNDTGAKKYGVKRIFTETQKERNRRKKCVQQTFQQTRVLMERFSSMLKPETYSTLAAFVSIENMPLLKKQAKIIRHKFYKQGILRNLNWFFN